MSQAAFYVDPQHPMGEPMHTLWACRSTGCFHCSRCGFGPQILLYYLYWGTGSDDDVPPEVGLCARCSQGLP